MSREKKTTLFSKNHIMVEKIDHIFLPDFIKNQLKEEKGGYCIQYTSNAYSAYQMRDAIEGKKIDKDHVEITKVSPLGFYYKQTINISRKVEYARRTVMGLEYRYKDTKYKLSFFIAYDDNTVSKTEDSIRPWDVVPGDKEFTDNNIKTLTSELEKLFSMIEDNGCETVHDKEKHWSFYYRRENEPVKKLHDVKREIYSYMFGNPKGMRTQTNEEKILAHGFDLKSSFRKDKES